MLLDTLHLLGLCFTQSDSKIGKLYKRSYGAHWNSSLCFVILCGFLMNMHWNVDEFHLSDRLVSFLSIFTLVFHIVKLVLFLFFYWHTGRIWWFSVCIWSLDCRALSLSANHLNAKTFYPSTTCVFRSPIFCNDRQTVLKIILRLFSVLWPLAKLYNALFSQHLNVATLSWVTFYAEAFDHFVTTCSSCGVSFY
jgi:hypothetical protein